MLGFINNAASLLPAFDLFVLPSRKEGLPYTLLEAMSQGVPLVATSVGAITDVITNTKNGLIVPPDDPSALSQAIMYAVGHQNDIQLMAVAAKKTASAFSLSAMIKKTMMAYRKPAEWS